jgi:DNA repair exonuclease SbcCD nuclease subunit
VHASEIVCRDPWIVYPGNLQGRSVREAGAKGAMRVTVEDGRIVNVTPIALDGARWAQVPVDVTGVESENDVVTRIAAGLAGAHAEGEGRPLAARVTLTGATSLHNRLVARRELLQDDVRASGFRIADDCWVEQLKVKTSPPCSPGPLPSAESLDVESLLAEAAGDPRFAEILSELIETIRAKLPRDLHDDLDQSETLRALADDARALLAGELS